MLKNGKTPFDEWFYELDKANKNKVQVRLIRIKVGLYGDYRNLANNITEIKFKNGLRIYFSEVEKTILLLCGGSKTRQSNDIKKVQEYLHDYKERSSKNE